MPALYPLCVRSVSAAYIYWVSRPVCFLCPHYVRSVSALCPLCARCASLVSPARLLCPPSIRFVSALYPLCVRSVSALYPLCIRSVSALCPAGVPGARGAALGSGSYRPRRGRAAGRLLRPRMAGASIYLQPYNHLELINSNKLDSNNT